MIKRRKYRWGGMYGLTHHGWVLYVFGCPVWRHKRAIEQ